MLPSLDQLLTPETEERLRKIYSDDYKMISVIECQSTRYVTANDLDFSANFDSTADKIKNKLGAHISSRRPAERCHESIGRVRDA